jgi:UDP-glucose 4-epimerase
MKLDQALKSLRDKVLKRKKRALVTGGSGYLGSHVCKLLKKQGWRVHVLDIRKPEHNYYDFLHIQDICDFDELKRIFWLYPDFDVVFHFAGKIEVGESTRKPTHYFRTNVAGTCLLLYMMNLTSCKNIIYSSTAGLYKTSNEQLKETDELNPDNNPYAGSKYASEIAIRQSGLNYIIFRYFNLAGADEEGDIGENHDPETHLIPRILQNLNNVEIYGNDYDTKDGTCVRDYVHVSDVAEIHLTAANHLIEEKESYIMNLGTGVGYSVSEIIDTVEKITNEKVTRKNLTRRLGDPPKLISNIELSKRVFGFTPKHDLTSIIKTAYNWEKNGRKTP